MHVNLSGRQLEEQRLVGEVVQALETARLSARLLTLEITESVLVSGVEAEQASHLATLGCQDGQGYLFAGRWTPGP
jgi:EAL domain-containing protein (putative c-di-GMP-specific phosphodiesterase class I)